MRRAIVQHFIRHRRAREASILDRLKAGETDIPSLVRDIYVGLDPRLTRAAGLSVLAHLEDLVARGRSRPRARRPPAAAIAWRSADSWAP